MGAADAAGRIVQFGTGRILQAHAALFAREARLAGQAVAQRSGAARRARHAGGLAA